MLRKILQNAKVTKEKQVFGKESTQKNLFVDSSQSDSFNNFFTVCTELRTPALKFSIVNKKEPWYFFNSQSNSLKKEKQWPQP